MTAQPHPQESDADEFRITRWQLSQVAKYADLERIVWAILNKPVSHTSAGQPEAQQRIDAAIKELEAARQNSAVLYTSRDFVDARIKKAIALLQEGRK